MRLRCRRFGSGAFWLDEIRCCCVTDPVLSAAHATTRFARIQRPFGILSGEAACVHEAIQHVAHELARFDGGMGFAKSLEFAQFPLQLLGKGMLLLGVLGASVGFGIQRAQCRGGGGSMLEARVRGRPSARQP